MITEKDRNANILKIIDLTKNLTDDEIRDLTNVAIGISIVGSKSQAS